MSASRDIREIALAAHPLVLAFRDAVEPLPAERRGDVALLGAGQILFLVLSGAPAAQRHDMFGLLLSTLFACGAELGVDIVAAAETAASTARLSAPAQSAAAGLH